MSNGLLRLRLAMTVIARSAATWQSSLADQRFLLLAYRFTGEVNAQFLENLAVNFA